VKIARDTVSEHGGQIVGRTPGETSCPFPARTNREGK
jgi:hypothetical protein